MHLGCCNVHEAMNRSLGIRAGILGETGVVAAKDDAEVGIECRKQPIQIRSSDI